MKPPLTLSLAAFALAAGVLFVSGPVGAQAPAPAPAAGEKAAAPAESPAPDAAAPAEEEEERIDGWQNVHLIKSTAPGAVDADAAIHLARRNGCFRCHALDRVKTGPAFKSVAEGYRNDYVGGLNREDSHLTAGDMFVLNGNVDKHRVLRTNPPNDPAQLKNLIDWILTLE
jgi:cytochrome c